MRARHCGDSRGRGSKTEDFLRFLACARDPLRGSCVSKRSRCGAVRICLSLGEPSAEIVRVEALSLWRRALSVQEAEVEGAVFPPKHQSLKEGSPNKSPNFPWLCFGNSAFGVRGSVDALNIAKKGSNQPPISERQFCGVALYIQYCGWTKSCTT